jgi:hypothetical protein
MKRGMETSNNQHPTSNIQWVRIGALTERRLQPAASGLATVRSLPTEVGVPVQGCNSRKEFSGKSHFAPERGCVVSTSRSRPVNYTLPGLSLRAAAVLKASHSAASNSFHEPFSAPGERTPVATGEATVEPVEKTQKHLEPRRGERVRRPLRGEKPGLNSDPRVSLSLHPWLPSSTPLECWFMVPMRAQLGVKAAHELTTAQIEPIGCSLLDVGCWMFPR